MKSRTGDVLTPEQAVQIISEIPPHDRCDMCKGHTFTRKCGRHIRQHGPFPLHVCFACAVVLDRRKK